MGRVSKFRCLLTVVGAGAGALAATGAAAEAIAAPAIVQPVASQWSVDAARQLAEVIAGAAAEGLQPNEYGQARLHRAIEDGVGPALDAVANQAALALARDYAFGRVADREGMDWHIAADPRFATLAADLQTAIAAGKPRAFLEGLLPSNERYRALRSALAETSDPAARALLRANMERWRWMPRELGDAYLYVNVPSYQLKVMADGMTQSRYTVVVGAKETPTPQMVTPANSFVVNPWWNVPQSIVKSSNLQPGRAGYQFTAIKGGWQVRQPPGPRNALGRLKINLANDQAIYLHDTPAKAGFAKSARALSHGCIRVKDIDRLAEELMGDAAADGRLDTALAGEETTTLRLPRAWTVYLVYFTADLGDDGTVVTYGDPYARDAALIARLDRRSDGAMQVAAR